MSCSNTSVMIPKLKEQGAFRCPEGKGKCCTAGVLGDTAQGINTDQPHVTSGLGLCFSRVLVVVQKAFPGDLQSYRIQCSHQKCISKQSEERRWSVPDLCLPRAEGSVLVPWQLSITRYQGCCSQFWLHLKPLPEP